MLHYYRFHADLPHLVAAKPVYVKHASGSGWPDHCPPIRAVQSFGWDVINPFAMRFLRDVQGNWDIEEAVEVESDLELPEGQSLHPQINAWFWEKGQQRPHVISDNVYPAIRHQCKVSTYLYLQTEPGWVLALRDIPNARRPFRVMESLIETDWYKPAHPWHGVIELPRAEESDIREVVIAEGEPLFRLVPVQRADYPAAEMDEAAFTEYFEASQSWLASHGKAPQGDDVDITGAYAKQMDDSTFEVKPNSKSQ